MAIGSTDMIFHLRQHQETTRQFSVGPPLSGVQNASIPAGTLIISDDFISSDDGKSHGELVNLAARRDGFQGPVLTQSYRSPMQRAGALVAAQETFFNPSATPNEMRSAVSSFASTNALGLLEGQTQAVNNATASGARNSVLNMSQGSSQARLADELYGNASLAWDKSPEISDDLRELGTTMAQNFAKAYDLDLARLTHDNPKVSGPERARLQQALISQVNGAVTNNPEVAKAKREFTTAVGRFESGRNSVVISAGNEGDTLSLFQKDAHGYTPQSVPEDFNRNFLDTPEATMVGATRWHIRDGQPTETVANYNNTNSGNDIYASGSLATKSPQKADTFGTSFAAPRVAATMATLHRLNPNLSSSQVEAMMKSSLTHQLNTGDGSVSVLDYQLSSDLMVGRKSD